MFFIRNQVEKVEKVKKVKKVKEVKKVEKARDPESPKAQQIPGQHQQSLTRGYQHQIMPYGHRPSRTVANINGFLCFSYVCPMPAWPDIGK